MPRFIDITGRKFGRLTVRHKDAQESGNPSDRIKWVCECECGNISSVQGSQLRSGRTKSCGCLRDEVVGNRMRTHGLSHDPDFRESERLRRLYGITLAEKIAMYEAQLGECAICNCSIDERAAHVDHCHDTGVVRGLLCSRCNKALGLLNDDVEIALSAYKYLKTYGDA